jgi:hypothetical protein
MTKLEDKIRKELEEEAKEWIQEEYRRRQKLVREEIQKQVAYAEEHEGSHGAAAVRSYHEKAMGYAMNELRNQLQFEADQWIIEEMGKRLETAKKEGAGKKKASAKTRGRSDTEKKAKAKPGTTAKASAKTKTRT